MGFMRNSKQRTERMYEIAQSHTAQFVTGIEATRSVLADTDLEKYKLPGSAVTDIVAVAFRGQIMQEAMGRGIKARDYAGNLALMEGMQEAAEVAVTRHFAKSIDF